MVNLGVTGVEMCKKLRERGINCDNAAFSKAVNYKLNFPKDRKIRDAVIEILRDLERK